MFKSVNEKCKRVLQNNYISLMLYTAAFNDPYHFLAVITRIVSILHQHLTMLIFLMALQLLDYYPCRKT